MTAEVSHTSITETEDGWYVVITDVANAVIRTKGKRITVAVTPDDDTDTTPLEVTLEDGA
jgi:hypothetical protein